IGESEVPCVSPNVRYLVFCRLGKCAPAAANQVKLVHLAVVHGQQRTVPAITEMAPVILVRHGAQRDPLAARKQARGGAFGTGESAEIVIERVILADDKNGVVNHVEVPGNQRSNGSRAPGEKPEPEQEHQRNKGCAGAEYALEPNRAELPMR